MINSEDKADVSKAFGKKAGKAISEATRDYKTAPATKASKQRGQHSTGSNFNAKTSYENLSRFKRMSGDDSKSKALKSKGSFISRLEAHKAEGASFDNGSWKPKRKGQSFIQALEEHKSKREFD